jgi:hypothetical protein
MPAPTTYFLSFLWRRAGADFWHPVDTTSAEHPLDYIARARQAAEGYEFCLLFFRLIPLDVYERHRPPPPVE